MINSKYEKDIISVYKNLGGVTDKLIFRLGGYDIQTDKFIIELDEELHFNRYRKITLQSQLYNELKKFPLENYKKYCDIYELQCLKAGSYGGKWCNSSTEKQFGKSSTKGDLNGNGASRWKQRAFYDFLKDISHLFIDVNIIRILVWDEVIIGEERKNIGWLLDNKYEDELAKFIDHRIKEAF